jgi:probable rRNA maturation factor
MAMDLDVTVDLRHPGWKTLIRPYRKTVRDTCHATLLDTRLASVPCTWEMAVVLADDVFIRELNREYRGFDKPTNVLSFPAEEALEKNAKRRAASRKVMALGDLVLAYETIIREAEAQGKKVKDHVRHLLVHGTLHLLGYDHIHKEEAEKMERLEIKILKKQKITNPYL